MKRILIGSLAFAALTGQAESLLKDFGYPSTDGHSIVAMTAGESELNPDKIKIRAESFCQMQGFAEVSSFHYSSKDALVSGHGDVAFDDIVCKASGAAASLTACLPETAPPLAKEMELLQPSVTAIQPTAPAAFVLPAQAQPVLPSSVVMNSTSINRNYDKACASKGNDTLALIGKVESRFPALRGLIQQRSEVTNNPTQRWDFCASRIQNGGEEVCTFESVVVEDRDRDRDIWRNGRRDDRHEDRHEVRRENRRICRWQPRYACMGAYVRADHLSCGTTLTLNSSTYYLEPIQISDSNSVGQMQAAMAAENVIYNEVDGDTHTARWVAVKKR